MTALRLPSRSVGTLLLVSSIGLLAFGWPFLAEPGSDLAHSTDGPWLFALLLPLLLAVLIAHLSEGALDAKAVALLGVLAAVAAALRPLGGGATGFQPMFVVVILGGRALGPGFGFLLGAIGMFASALITGGIGPWLPFQMLGAAWIGLFAGLLPPARGRSETWLLVGYGVVAGLAYGFLLNLWFWPFVAGADSGISFVAGDPVTENLARFIAFCLVTSLGFDIPRAIGNAILLAFLTGPVLRTLRRTARRAAFDAQADFAAVR
jgi:energy-coupling factor transport system substrate-specific component